MKRLQRDSVLLALIQAMKNRSSWCGQTHVQKSTYFLQELLGVPLGFDFLLYKHGPYSFELSDALAQMQADGLLALAPRPPYGPSLLPGPNSTLLERLFTKTRRRFAPQIEFLADKLASRNVAALERLGTAMYVTLEELSGQSLEERAACIHGLKPHISLDEARTAIVEFDAIYEEARRKAA